MGIVGHGVDIVSIGEFQALVELPADQFRERCFTAQEQLDAGSGPNSVERFAGRFAAKEAVLKAIGVGWGDGIAFTDVEIRTMDSGAPHVILHGRALILATANGVTTWFLSTSHSGGFAIASVIATNDLHDTSPPISAPETTQAG